MTHIFIHLTTFFCVWAIGVVLVELWLKPLLTKDGFYSDDNRDIVEIVSRAWPISLPLLACTLILSKFSPKFRSWLLNRELERRMAKGSIIPAPVPISEDDFDEFEDEDNH